MSVDIVIKETKPKMEAVIEDFKRKLANVRTGRATVGILDGVTVDYYGVPTPLNQMASIKCSRTADADRSAVGCNADRRDRKSDQRRQSRYESVKRRQSHSSADSRP